MTSRRVAIIGGGISGLATAFYLGRRDICSVLVEKSDRLGGLIRTDTCEGCRLEAGPDSFIANKTAVTELAAELGLSGELVGSNDAARRVFIVRGGELLPLPSGMTMMVPGKLLPAMRSKLFSSKTKLRILRERSAKPRLRPSDFSVGELVGDHFGREVLDYVADPLLAGVYGGNSGELSAVSVLPRFAAYERNYGSLVRGVQAEEQAHTPRAGSLFLSFREGMQTVTDRLAQAVAPYTILEHGEAVSIARSPEAWQIRLGDRSVSADQLVLACPARVCARLLSGCSPDLAAELAQIPYSSAILATLIFDRAAVHHPLDGFGFLVPEPERTTIAAATWINTKFPTRVAVNRVALRAFIVAGEAGRRRHASDDELALAVRDDFRRLMGLRAQPLAASIERWPDSMPQYVVGHGARLERIRALLTEQSGLYLVGNAYDGVGLPDCVRLAKTTAEAIARN